MTACPLGDRASNSSSTRGRPWVMSSVPATPPVWKVRMVSCVPGSPMDWAAMMPTASPGLHQAPARQVAPVAAAADPLPGLAGERRADVDLVDAAPH